MLPFAVCQVLDATKAQQIIGELNKSLKNVPKDVSGQLAFQVFEGQNPNNVVSELFNQAQFVRKNLQNVEWR
jgi:hypothetical protein